METVSRQLGIYRNTGQRCPKLIATKNKQFDNSIKRKAHENKVGRKSDYI